MWALAFSKFSRRSCLVIGYCEAIFGAGNTCTDNVTELIAKPQHLFSWACISDGVL